MWEGVIKSVIYYKIGINSIVVLDALVFNNTYVYYLNFYPSSGFTRTKSLAAVCDVKLGTGSCNALIHAFLSQERRLPFMHSVASCRIPQECWTQVRTIVDLRGTQRRKRVKRLPWSLQLCISFLFGWFPVLLEWNTNSMCSSSLCSLLWAQSSEPG